VVGGREATLTGTDAAMRKKVVLLIPQRYNDGSEIPAEVLQTVYDDLYGAGDGYSSAGEVFGVFRMADGTRHEDVLDQVWVAVEEEDLPALRKMVARHGRLLRQEKMYFEITESVFELLPPDKDQRDEQAD